MDEDEEKVQRYLEDRRFTVERFTKAEIRAGKTPDFRVLRDGDFKFFCEVKSSLEDRWLDGQLDNAEPGQLVGGARNDPIFNRLTDDIHTSVKQFDAVNGRSEHPNVLALINHDENCGFNDLLAVLTGNFYAEDGSAHPIYRQFSHGRILEEKERIHLFIWLDDHKPTQLLFSQTDPDCHTRLIDAFGVSQDEITQVDP